MDLTTEAARGNLMTIPASGIRHRSGIARSRIAAIA